MPEFCSGKEINEKIYRMDMKNVAIPDITKNLGRDGVALCAPILHSGNGDAVYDRVDRRHFVCSEYFLQRDYFNVMSRISERAAETVNHYFNPADGRKKLPRNLKNFHE